MSKLMDRRKAGQTKTSTVLVSVQTAQDAAKIGRSLLNQMLADDPNDARADKLAAAVDHLEALLYSQPDQMQQEGMTNVEEYFDTATNPETAQQAKNEVDMISQMRQEARRPAQVTQKAPATQPAMASADKEAAGSASDAFVTDRNEQGDPKAPERAEVPRLAAKKKEAQPEAAPAPVPPAAPAAGGGSLDALFAKLPSDFLADLVKKLTSLEGFEADKDVQAAVEKLAGILQSRPVEAAPAPAGAPAAAPTASLKKMFGGLRIAGMEKEAVAPPHSENVVKGLKKNPDVDNPWAVAWSMHDKGDKMSAFKAASQCIAKFAAAGFFTWDQATGDVTDDGGRTPEIGEAHSKIDESPAKLDRPETTLPIKLAADMTTPKAVKEAERLGQTLKQMYLDSKPLTGVNDSRPVKEAVEAIFRAGDLFGEAVKVLVKQQTQEESEEEAAKIKSKKSSALKGLALAAAE